MTTVIETRGLTKSYGAHRGIVDVDLDVEPGQVFAFLGPNGAGKTTTIRILLDLQRPSAGTARVLGLDAHHDAVAIHRRLGYLPGDLVLAPHMTGADYVKWFARARGLPDSLPRAQQLAGRFDLDLGRRTKELSKGNRQKVGIVLAFAHRPELLVLDEPTSGLDPLVEDEFEQLLAETAAEGATVFLSTHELDQVQRIAQRVAIIKDGRMVLSDSVDTLRRSVPQRMDLRFKEPIDPRRLDIAGVRVVSTNGPAVSLELTGDIGPVLHAVADLDPVELVTRHADLDELFLSVYRNPTEATTPAHVD
jgi:ABC-2 type transport system ATP-binding protein